MDDSHQPKRQRHAYMYTPFGGEDSLKSALGENMTRIANNKKPMGLIAPNHEMADTLEALRQTTLKGWGDTIAHSQQQIDVVGRRKLRSDSDFLARIRASVDAGGATVESTQDARRDAREAHQFENFNFDSHKLIHESRLSMLKPQHEALSKTRVINTSPGIYPDLFPDPPLSFLRSDTPYSGGDKLYVLGHGSPQDKNLYAKSDGSGGKLDATALATHLRDAGLPTTAMDVRLTACQGVPELQEHSDNPALATRNSGYLVPEVAKAFHGLGFRDLTVTGYQGNGVTFPFDSKHRLRSAPDDDKDRVRRSLAAIRYPVRDMGD